MKKVIAFALSLVMCLSIFSATAVTVFAAGSATDFFDVTSTGVQNSKITYVINLKPGIMKFNGAVLNIEFDPEVLEIESCEPVFTVDEEGNQNPVVPGEYIKGFLSGSNSVYSVAYMSNSGFTTSGNYVGFYKVTFNIITDERPSTDVSFYCVEFSSDDDLNNDIRPSDGRKIIKKFNFSTLDNPMPLSAELLANAIKFEWRAVPGAEKYTVMRKADNVGVWETMAELSESELSYVDTRVESGVTYTYSVKCGNGYGNSGFFASGSSCLYLAPPKITSISNQGNTVRVAWSASGGAESYAVYRKGALDTEWTCLGKTASTRLFYIDEAVESGASYKYAIGAERGEVSSIVGVNSEDHQFIGAPTITDIKNTIEGIAVTWAAVSGVDAYLLYRKAAYDSEWSLLSTETATSFVDTTALEGVTYNYSLKTVKGDVISSFDTTGVTISRISAPQITSLEAVAEGVNVYWSKNPVATGYVIYRKAHDEADWKKVASVGAVAGSYKDTSAEGGYYSYAVSATLDKYESVKATFDTEVYFLASPKNLNVKNEIEGLGISWNASKNAEYYIIRKIVNSSGEVVGVAEVKNNSFVDTDVKHLSTYSYSVTAVDSDGISSVGNPYTQEIYRVLPPAVTGVYPNTTAVNISWSGIDGVDSYNIYRREENGSWFKVGSTAKDVLSFDDATVTSGVKYYFTVTAVKNNTESYIGDDNAKSVIYVNIPMSLSASLTSTGIKLSWDTGDGLSKFNIYKRAKGQNDWIYFTTTNSDITTVLDTDVASGKTYEYALRAISNDGNFQSEMSEPIEVIYLSMVPSIKTGNKAGYVKIKWGEVAGAEQYVVYRKLSNGSWEVLKTLGADVRSFNDKTAESGKTYYYTVRAYTNGWKSAYKSYKRYCIASPKITKLDSQYNKGITIKWADVHGAEKYYVYRKTSGTDYKKIGTTENLLFVDKNVTFGKKYTYIVKANGNGYTSSYYSGKSKTYTTGVPEISSISAASSGITVKWNKISGASGYKLYRKAEGEAKWSQIAKISATSYKDTNVSKNVKYYYTVKSYRNKVASSYNKDGWAGAIISKPSVKISNTTSGMKVKWSKRACADKYIIYRSQYNTATGKWGSWSKQKTVSGTKTTWTDAKALSGVKYKYTVKAVCGLVKSSIKSSNVLIYLAYPKAKASINTGRIKVSWSKVEGVTGYKIYRSQLDTATGKWSSWKALTKVTSSKSYWYDKGVTEGKIYKYRVCSVNGGTLSSYKSTSSVMYIATPELLSGIATAEGNIIEFSKVSGVDGYIICRKTDGGSWVRIATVTENSFKDTSVEAGKEYIYTVRAFSGEYLSYYDKDGITCK